MPVVPGIDQLDADHDAVPAAPDASFEHVHDAKRLGDLRQIVFGRAAIRHDRRAADNFQIANLRQAGQDVVLDAVGEKRVLLVVAEVFEGQYGDAFLGKAGGGLGGMEALVNQKSDGAKQDGDNQSVERL